MQIRRSDEKWTEGMSRRQFLVGALGIGFTAGGGGTLINERNEIEITHHVLNPEASPAEGRVSFVQLSDLHLDRIGRHEERVGEAVNWLRPDFLVITGDTIERADRLSVLDTFLGLLDPIEGFAALGNWEHQSHVDLGALERTYSLHNINLLLNQSAVLVHGGKRILITGLDDLVAGSPSLERALAGVRASRHHVILAHSPAHRDALLNDTAWASKLDGTSPTLAGKNGTVLILSGHTHGGQICPRGRPYQKDDNAHVEQKNWTHVRKLLGYVRFDSPEACAAMNDLYRNELRLLQNLFLPSVKLLRKVRMGSRLRRVYDRPQTPFERVLACPEADPVKVAQLQVLRKQLDPFALGEAIDQKLTQLYALARHRAKSEPKPTPAGLTAVERQVVQALSQGFGIPVYVGTEEGLCKGRVTSQMARRSGSK